MNIPIGILPTENRAPTGNVALECPPCLDLDFDVATDPVKPAAEPSMLTLEMQRLENAAQRCLRDAEVTDTEGNLQIQQAAYEALGESLIALARRLLQDGEPPPRSDQPRTLEGALETPISPEKRSHRSERLSYLTPLPRSVAG